MRAIRLILLLAGTIVMVGLMLVSLESLAEPVTLATSSAAAAPLGATSTLTLTLSGPDTAALNEVVTYTVNYVDPGDWSLAIEYTTPPGFTVTSTDPATSTMLGANILRWNYEKLQGRSLITVTGKHVIGCCSPATHRVRFYDIYNPDVSLPEDSKTTTITGLHCIYLPAVMRTFP